MRISGCIITKNEEKNIVNCIESLKRIVDEIIVVDTGSEDDTVRVAEERGAFVLKRKWENDFSGVRNLALERAGGDWIVFLDADEYFREDSAAKVRPLIEKVHPNREIEGIRCEIVNIDKDTGKIISNGEVIRIFRKYKKLRYVNKIHEELRNNGVPIKYINLRNELSLLHTGYSASVQQDKARRNLELLKDNADDDKAAYYLATTYFLLGDYKNAYWYADLALASETIAARDALAYKLHSLRIFITAKAEPSNKEKIRRLLDEANQKYGNHPEIAAMEAAYLLSEKYYEKALEKYLYALDCQEKYGRTFEQNDFFGTVGKVYYEIAYILCLMNREADALEYYDKALRSDKYHSKAFGGMFALFGSLPENEIVAFINSIYDINNADDVKFITGRVADCGRPKIVLYYADKWINTFGNEDDILIFVLTAQSRYIDALKIALLYLKTDREKYTPVVMTVIILGRLYSEAEEIKDEIGPDYFDIVRCCEEGSKFSGDRDAFINVLSKLVKQEHYDIDGYVIICAEPDAETALNIAGVLSANRRFGQAEAYFRCAFESSVDKSVKAKAAFQAGYCCYKLKQYEESVSWLEKAAMNGYDEPDAAEFLRWNAEHISETRTSPNN